jgi:hypothetical protein
MPDKADAEVLQVVDGQLGQYRSVDRVVAKRLFVLLQSETTEPDPDVHARLLDAVTTTLLYLSANQSGARTVSAACRRPRSPEHYSAPAGLIGLSGYRALGRTGTLTPSWRTSALGHRLPSVGTRGASVVPSAPDIAAAARDR